MASASTPAVKEGRLRFITESRLLAANGKTIGYLTSHGTLCALREEFWATGKKQESTSALAMRRVIVDDRRT